MCKFFKLKKIILQTFILHIFVLVNSSMSLEKYYDGIIENLRLNLQVAEERIRRLQDSEFKLECEIEELKQELEEKN